MARWSDSHSRLVALLLLVRTASASLRTSATPDTSPDDHIRLRLDHPTSFDANPLPGNITPGLYVTTRPVPADDRPLYRTNSGHRVPLFTDIQNQDRDRTNTHSYTHAHYAGPHELCEKEKHRHPRAARFGSSRVSTLSVWARVLFSVATPPLRRFFLSVIHQSLARLLPCFILLRQLLTAVSVVREGSYTLASSPAILICLPHQQRSVTSSSLVFRAHHTSTFSTSIPTSPVQQR